MSRRRRRARSARGLPEATREDRFARNCADRNHVREVCVPRCAHRLRPCRHRRRRTHGDECDAMLRVVAQRQRLAQDRPGACTRSRHELPPRQAGRTIRSARPRQRAHCCNTVGAATRCAVPWQWPSIAAETSAVCAALRPSDPSRRYPHPTAQPRKRKALRSPQRPHRSAPPRIFRRQKERARPAARPCWTGRQLDAAPWLRYLLTRLRCRPVRRRHPDRADCPCLPAGCSA